MSLDVKYICLSLKKNGYKVLNRILEVNNLFLLDMMEVGFTVYKINIELFVPKMWFLIKDLFSY